jgi:hypothetical protein
VAVTGGIDRNMGVSTFVKFCKIGALSATSVALVIPSAPPFVIQIAMALAGMVGGGKS